MRSKLVSCWKALLREVSTAPCEQEFRHVQRLCERSRRLFNTPELMRTISWRILTKRVSRLCPNIRSRAVRGTWINSSGSCVGLTLFCFKWRLNQNPSSSLFWNNPPGSSHIWNPNHFLLDMANLTQTASGEQWQSQPLKAGIPSVLRRSLRRLSTSKKKKMVTLYTSALRQSCACLLWGPSAFE